MRYLQLPTCRLVQTNAVHQEEAASLKEGSSWPNKCIRRSASSLIIMNHSTCNSEKTPLELHHHNILSRPKISSSISKIITNTIIFPNLSIRSWPIRSSACPLTLVAWVVPSPLLRTISWTRVSRSPSFINSNAQAASTSSQMRPTWRTTLRVSTSTWTASVAWIEHPSTAQTSVQNVRQSSFRLPIPSWIRSTYSQGPPTQAPPGTCGYIPEPAEAAPDTKSKARLPSDQTWDVETYF